MGWRRKRVSKQDFCLQAVHCRSLRPQNPAHYLWQSAYKWIGLFELHMGYHLQNDSKPRLTQQLIGLLGRLNSGNYRLGLLHQASHKMLGGKSKEHRGKTCRRSQSNPMANGCTTICWTGVPQKLLALRLSQKNAVPASDTRFKRHRKRKAQWSARFSRSAFAWT